MIGKKQSARDALLAEFIRCGQVRHWRDACLVFKDVSWPVVRASLKRLRDKGLIGTTPEYTSIWPTSGQVQGGAE